MVEQETEINLDLSILKKVKFTHVLLAAFLIFGFYLRIYHADFPAIGYHNAKEGEYLDQAVFFMEEGNWLHKKAFAFYGLDEGLGYHEEYGQAPLIPYMVVVLWWIFGEKILLARLLMIAFFLGAIFVTYLLVKRMTKNEYLSLLSAFFMTIMPLGIYFGRNVQPEPPSLFFMLLSLLFYFKWIEEGKTKDAFYTTLCLGIGSLFKYHFFIIALPMAFVFPYKKVYAQFKEKSKEFWTTVKNAFYGFLPLIIGVIVFEFLTIVDKTKKNYVFDFFRIFSSEFWAPRWPIVSSFIRDNYTWWFVWFALLGLLFVAFRYRTQFSRFLIGYALTIIVYVAGVSEKIAGHSYYQMPFLPLICILSAYFFFTAGSILKQIVKIKYAIYVPLLLLLLTIPEMEAANDRVWGTIFFGQDVVGQWIQERTQWGDRLISLTYNAQAHATCSYAKRSCGGVSSVEELKHKEDVFNIPYLVIDAQSMGSYNKEVMDYVLANYRIVLAGLIRTNDGLAPLQFVVKKGGSFNIAELQTKQPRLAKTYDTKRGNVEFYLIENE